MLAVLKLMQILNIYTIFIKKAKYARGTKRRVWKVSGRALRLCLWPGHRLGSLRSHFVLQIHQSVAASRLQHISHASLEFSNLNWQTTGGYRRREVTSWTSTTTRKTDGTAQEACFKPGGGSNGDGDGGGGVDKSFLPTLLPLLRKTFAGVAEAAQNLCPKMIWLLKWQLGFKNVLTWHPPGILLHGGAPLSPNRRLNAPKWIFPAHSLAGKSFGCTFEQSLFVCLKFLAKHCQRLNRPRGGS